MRCRWSVGPSGSHSSGVWERPEASSQEEDGPRRAASEHWQQHKRPALPGSAAGLTKQGHHRSLTGCSSPAPSEAARRCPNAR